MQVELQPLTTKNYHQAFVIQHKCHSHPWSEKVFADCLTSPYFARHLLEAGKPIGYYIGLQVLDEATLMDIGIAEGQRGKGHAKHLLAGFIGYCEQQEVQHIWLEVRKSNQPAIGLYQQAGFILVEERKNYYPSENGKENALIMKKSLG